jgi:hypothetical protein
MLASMAPADRALADDEIPLLAAGDPLPPLRGKDLADRTVVVPDSCRGRVTLLALGFTYGSRLAVEDWTKRFREDFGRDSLATFYEVPMIGGLSKLGKPFIQSGMRRGTPRELHGNVITVYGGTGPWKERLGYQEENEAYLVLLDPEGRVQWIGHGRFGPILYDALAAATRGLLSTVAGRTSGP